MPTNMRRQIWTLLIEATSTDAPISPPARSHVTIAEAAPYNRVPLVRAVAALGIR